MYRRLRLLTLIILLSQVISYGATRLIPPGSARVISSVPGRIESLAALLASFSFTMLGFLAAVLALFGIMFGSSLLTQYRKHGHLDVLLFVMGLTMLFLVATFATSVAAYICPITETYLKTLAWLVTTDFVLLLISTLPVVMLVKGTVKSVSGDPCAR